MLLAIYSIVHNPDKYIQNTLISDNNLAKILSFGTKILTSTRLRVLTRRTERS